MNIIDSAIILQLPHVRLSNLLRIVPTRFGTTEGVAYYLEATAAIEAVERAHPGLSRNGWRTSRNTPGSPLEHECVATCLVFLDSGQFERIEKWPRFPTTSYSLKHSCEEWGRASGWSPYVANGDFLCACIHRGIFMNRIPNSPNSIVGLRRPKDLKVTQ